jgi:hypothetical protein
MQAEFSRFHQERQGREEYKGQVTHPQTDFNERLDAVVQRFLERASQRGFDQPADEDYAMRWAIARHLRIQARSVKGEHHVAA